MRLRLLAPPRVLWQLVHGVPFAALMYCMSACGVSGVEHPYVERMPTDSSLGAENSRLLARIIERVAWSEETAPARERSPLDPNLSAYCVRKFRSHGGAGQVRPANRSGSHGARSTEPRRGPPRYGSGNVMLTALPLNVKDMALTTLPL
jgi:hypothetical protein